jgi:electron transport complex protein RnfC
MKTFRIGGVHPAENKLSAAEPIKVAALPKIAVFPMSQHIGAPSIPVVQKGDKVKVGTLIGKPMEKALSTSIFSSVSGTVLKVDTVIDASGYKKPAVYVSVEGDEWEEGIDRSEKLVTLKDKPELTPEDIINKVKEAGVVGMGGACFPTHVKLMPPPQFKPEWVIINAVECEPYLTADHRLMLEKPEQILVGVDLLMKAGKVSKGFIAIEENKPDAIRLMTEKCAASYPNIEVVPLKTKYPQGGEKQLIDAVVRRQVPAPPALPVSVGAIVQNVGTAYAVYEAVMKNKPLFERIVTVTGKQLKQPGNFLVRMGTPMSQLIDACGGLPEGENKIIGGGPMMGKALVNAEVPICKGSSGVLIMTGAEARRGASQPCIRCAKCVGACPMGLEPYLLATASKRQMWDKVEAEDITSCIECGSCQFTCPSNRPLLDLIRMGKQTVMGIIRSRQAAVPKK